jgi:hypothetical protein
MINIGKILKRSWYILWHYRILWIFGILLALTTGGGSSGNNGGSSSSTSPTPRTNFNAPDMLPENAPEWARQLAQWFTQNVEPVFTHPAEHIGTIVTVVAIFFLIILVLSALTAFVRYPVETAVMRMVDEYEQSGTKLGFRQGWKLGWTRRAFRLWLVDLLIALPILMFVLLILVAGWIVYLSVSSTFQVTNAAGVVAGIGLAFLSVFPMIAVAVFLGLLRNFFARAVALEDMNLQAALSYGWAMFKRNWKSAGLMWLVMVGIGIGVGIASMIVFFLLIPAYLILLIPAAFVAVLPALIAFGISSAFTSGPLAWIIAALVAMPFFFITLLLPMFLVSGWYKVYESSVWTLTYREIKALESLATPALPVESAPNAV